MSIGIALSAALMLAAAAPAQTVAAAPSTAAAVNPLAREPMYADIVKRAEALKAEISRYRAGAAVPADLTRFKADLTTLSELDMKGHFDLQKRGTDGDLKCILKGISEDLPKKLAELQAASAPAARATALEDLFYLLRDNVEVITTPPTVQSSAPVAG
jgi:hypothetical protein